MIHAVTDGCSTFGLELCVCSRCKALLTRYDFRFDWLGRTIEHCPKCGPQLLAVQHGALRPRSHPVCKPRMIGECADCQKPMLWAGNGECPKRCKPCQKERGRVRDLAYYHKKQSRIKNCDMVTVK